MAISKNYNRGRFVVDNWEFTEGGDGDVYFCNFISDASQGFKVPAKSLYIQNHGGGAGYNYLYYRTIHSDFGTSKQIRIRPDEYVNYQLGEAVFYGVLLWASNANLQFSLDATPGEWDDREVAEFIANPLLKKTLARLDDQLLTTGLVL
jgi:hypothetical protein